MKKILLVFFMIAILPVSAQQQRLTLEQALDIAMSSNPAIQGAKEAERAAEFKRKATVGLRYPKLGATAAYTVMSQDIGSFDLNGQKDKALQVLGSLGLPIPPAIIEGLKSIDLSYTLQKSNFAMVGVQVAVPIFMGGKINAAVAAAKINEQTSNIKAEQISEELFVEVAQRYWGLLLQRQVETLLGEVEQGVALHLKNSQELEKNGIVARGETLFAEMAHSDAKTAYQKAKHESNTINSALGGSLGGIVADYEPITNLFITTEVESLESFKERVRVNNSQLKQVGLIKKLAEQGVRVERSGFFPQVAAMGGYDIWNHQLTDQLPRWVAGVGVTLNIFDGLTREYNYKAAKSQVKQVEAAQQKANIDIMILVEKLYNSLLSAQEQAIASGSNIAFGEEYLRIKQKAFAEGMATSSEVIDAQLNLNKYKTERLASLYAFDMTLSQLFALSGEPERIFEYLHHNPNEI